MKQKISIMPNGQTHQIIHEFQCNDGSISTFERKYTYLRFKEELKDYPSKHRTFVRIVYAGAVIKAGNPA